MARSRQRRCSGVERRSTGYLKEMRLEGAQLSVEVLGRGLRAVRVAGVLDAVTVLRVAAVVQTQSEAPQPCRHVVVDLGEVRWFGGGDLSALARVRDACGRLGVHVHLAGLAGREAVLPTVVTSALDRFSRFATVEQAQRELAGSAAPGQLGSGPRSRHGWPCSPVPVSVPAQDVPRPRSPR